MNELPTGWTSTKISEVAEVFLGKTPAKHDYVSEGRYKVIKFRDLKNGMVDFKNAKQGFIKADQTLLAKLKELRQGDVLITSAAHSGENIGKKCSYVSSLPPEFQSIYFTGEILNIRCNDETLGKWVYFFFQSNKGFEEIQNAVTGVHLTGGQAKLMTVPVAPPEEQRHIVAKLEKLLAKVGACQERLNKIPILLKRFRQSVLAAACSGRLTADWRCSANENNELPDGWRWILLEELLLKNGGIFDGPFGSNLKTADYTESGVRVIRLENIGHLTFFSNKKTFINEDKYQSLTKHTVKEGDIIFSSFITDEIRVCILPPLNTKAVAKADCFCLRPHDNLVARQYLTFQLVSRESYNVLVASVHGATRPRVNIKQLRKLEVRICPLTEQQEIVRRVETLFKIADQIEERYQKAKAHIDKLTQSILAKAFRGELINETDMRCEQSTLSQGDICKQSSR